MSLGADGKPSGANRLDDRPVVVVGAAGQLGRTMVASLAEGVADGGLDADGSRRQRRGRGARGDGQAPAAGYRQLRRLQPGRSGRGASRSTALEANAFAVLTLSARGDGVRRDARALTAATSCSTAKPIARTSRTIGRSRAARMPRRSCSASGSRRARRRIMCCASRACSAGRSGGRAAWTGSSMRSWPAGRRECSSTASCRRATRGTSTAATAAILRKRPPVGLYHCVNTGAATWHDLAVEVRRQSGIEPRSSRFA